MYNIQIWCLIICTQGFLFIKAPYMQIKKITDLYPKGTTLLYNKNKILLPNPAVNLKLEPLMVSLFTYKNGS